MKIKYLILLMSMMATGCFFGEVGSGITAKKCTRETTINDVTLIEEKLIKQKDNNIVNIVVTNKVVGKDNETSKALKNSYLSEANNLKNMGIVVNVISDIKNEYSVSYELDFSNISHEIKTKYGFEELYHNQLKKYENEGYKCQ